MEPAVLEIAEAAAGWTRVAVKLTLGVELAEPVGVTAKSVVGIAATEEGPAPVTGAPAVEERKALGMGTL